MDETLETQSLPKNVALRWAAVLPAAIAAALVGPLLVYLYHWLFDSQDPSRFNEWFTLVAQSFAMGAAFVWAGSYVAPAHQGKVAIGLAAIAIFIMGGTGVLFLQTQQWWNLSHVVISATAAGWAGYYLHMEHG
jgi:hypothetical protein